MAYEPKPGDGSLFKNEHRTEDKHPNATGYIVAHRDIKQGERVRLAAWTKDGGKGKFQSLRMSDERPKEEPADNLNDDPLDSSVPF